MSYKRMLSSICHVRTLLQEEMQLDSTFTDTPAISDASSITSMLESAHDDSPTEVADFVKSCLDSQLPVLGVGYTIPKHISPSVLFSASIDTTELEFSPLSFSVKEPTLPVKGYGHKLDKEFDCKVFDIVPTRDIFAAFLDRHTSTGSLSDALGLHICNWFDTGQVFLACFDKVNTCVYSISRVLLFGYSNGFPLLRVDASDVCDVSSMTTTHKVFVDMSGRYKYAYSFKLDSTGLYIESGTDIMIINRITLLHKIKCLQLPFDPGVYVTHDVGIFLFDMCKDIRSGTHIEYSCISANYAVGAVSPGALEKYFDAYDFLQYFYICNFNLSWQPYTAVASSYGDNSFSALGLWVQLNTAEVPIYLWYKSKVEINLTAGVLRSDNWRGLIVFSTDQVLHIFVKNQCARTIFGPLGNPERWCNSNINRRAGVNMNSGIIFNRGVVNDGPQYEKWNDSVFGPAPPSGLNQCLHLSSGHSIVEWVDGCSIFIFGIRIRSFCWLMSLRYPLTTILKKSSHIFSDDKKPDWFQQFNLKFPIHKFDHCWIQDAMMHEVLEKKAVLFKMIAPEVERANNFIGEQNKRVTIPYLRKQMIYEQPVDQLENFHLPLRDQMLLLKGANTTTNTVIDALETTKVVREVTQKAPTIEDIDKIIVATSEHIEIKKMLQEAIFLHVCAAADFVQSAGKIWFKLVEKVAVPGSAFWTTEMLQLPMPSIHNVLEELDPTILNALGSKLHKMFKISSLVLPSSSPKQLLDINLVRHGSILWFKRQNDGSLLKAALDNEVWKEFFGFTLI